MISKKVPLNQAYNVFDTDSTGNDLKEKYRDHIVLKETKILVGQKWNMAIHFKDRKLVRKSYITGFATLVIFFAFFNKTGIGFVPKNKTDTLLFTNEV